MIACFMGYVTPVGFMSYLLFKKKIPQTSLCLHGENAIIQFDLLLVLICVATMTFFITRKVSVFLKETESRTNSENKTNR